jgi:hypothetical protein
VTGGNFPLPQIKKDSMNNLLARIFKKNQGVVNLPQVETVLLIDPMISWQKIPELEKFAIIGQNLRNREKLLMTVPIIKNTVRTKEYDY